MNNYFLWRSLDDDYEELNWSGYDEVVQGSLFHKLEDGSLGYGKLGPAPRHRKCIPKWIRYVLELVH